jgi:hypothetical protein
MSRKPLFSRADGTYLRTLDPFMRFFPFIMIGRNESAVYFKQQIDVTNLKAFINQKNHETATKEGDGTKSTLFHGILAAIVKTAIERPQVNRFIIGRRIYQRHDLSCAFVVKSEFRDDANEEIAVMKFDEHDTMLTISDKLAAEVRRIREISRAKNKERAGAVNWLNYFMLMPRFILRAFVSFMTWLDYHGWLPRFVIEADPMHTSIFISNLGSLKIDAPFHHMYEWGTCSFFVTIGAINKTPTVMPDGTIASRDTINLGITIDERISDGYYYAKTIKRLQYLIEHPEELEKPSEPNRGRKAPVEDERYNKW